ncbi:hypothetical protein [Halomonas denitrificans]|uniref:hypothetical protein n=1 Tax=Halomonas denitrificans TaxID=370769 RepID=UPI001C991E31|nr:hypothetical protein [Halomonas denitrificans]MBY5969686.1 hypothetical protein [Halomonas denitrificans]
MQLSKLSHAKEVLRAANEIDVRATVLSKEEAEDIINHAINKFCPTKLTGHLSIGGNANSILTEKYEFSFSKKLEEKPAFIFFEQNDQQKNLVISIDNARFLSPLMENCYGMEYFVTDQDFSYLIAVNWYAIEFVGECSALLNPEL